MLACCLSLCLSFLCKEGFKHIQTVLRLSRYSRESQSCISSSPVISYCLTPHRNHSKHSSCHRSLGSGREIKKIISVLEITTFNLTPNTRAWKVMELLLATSAESCPKLQFRCSSLCYFLVMLASTWHPTAPPRTAPAVTAHLQCPRAHPGDRQGEDFPSSLGPVLSKHLEM